MTSFVVASTDKKIRIAYIEEYCLELNIDKLDINLIEKDASSKNISSIGIDEIKEIHKNVFLKPINSKIKAVVLEDAHLLTHQAQNALLKVIEEPPEHTIIILGAETTGSLLPTILSRCQVIELPANQVELTEEEIQEYTVFMESLIGMKIGDKLKKAEELAKDKSTAIIWIEKLILVLRSKLLERAALDTFDTFDTLDTLKKMQSLHTLIITTNVNPRFAIENTLLNINS